MTKKAKVLVLGLDGLDPRLTTDLIQTGELPNLAKLATAGGFAPVRTTMPAQTPVAWSTFATGVNPGAHGIFDFLSRDPGTYLPDLGLARYEQKNPFVPPRAVNLRRGRPLWDVLTEAGVPAVVLRCPCSYPPDRIKGRMLSGLGVPDVRGGLGTSTFFTSAKGEKARESEIVVPVTVEDGTVQTHLVGPRHPKTGEDAKLAMRIRLDPASSRAMLTSPGDPAELTLTEGEWSDWLRVKFKLGMLQSVHGMLRFFLVRQRPTFELYASPVNFDPALPLFPISAPWDYASELAREIGPYHTTGMVEDHTGLNNGRIDEAAFLAQCEDALREREAMLSRELDRFDEGLLFCLFDTPDRVQHMFWRFLEPRHPANRGAPPDPAFAEVVPDIYRRSDAIVGRALERVDSDTLCIVLSDHGFSSFRRGLNLNTWLYEAGLLALKDGAVPGADVGEFFHAVDWSRTSAYALGLSGLYLNRRGRERDGILDDEAARDIGARIVGALTGLVDSDGGAVAVRTVVPRERAYSGAYADEAPDLLVGYAPGYRVSWGTALGGVPAGIFEDNTKRWGGDHIIDPDLVPGVLFMNRRFDETSADLKDLAPTILAALGVPPDAAMEGRSLLARRTAPILSS